MFPLSAPAVVALFLYSLLPIVRNTHAGQNDIPLAVRDTRRVGYAVLWPHVRPWMFSQPQPMLRCVPDGEEYPRLVACESYAEEDPADLDLGGKRKIAVIHAQGQPTGNPFLYAPVEVV